MPIQQWLTQEKLKKLESEWDSKKSEDQNRGEFLWKVMLEAQKLHQINMGKDLLAQEKLEAIIKRPEDESWKTVEKREDISAAMKEPSSILVYTKDLEAVFGKIEDHDPEKEPEVGPSNKRQKLD